MLINKTVFITGSTRGIGKAIALAFAKQGANIILNGRKPIDKKLIHEFKSFKIDVLAVQGDIANVNDVQQMVKKIEERFEHVDILINNAGITKDNLMLRMSLQEFEDVLKVNLTGTFLITQALLKEMIKKRSGAIINLASVVGISGNAGQVNYAASKAGIIGFTKSLAREVASRNITCNAVAPGFIETDMTKNLSSEVRKSTCDQIPLKKFGRVEDVAAACLFLAKSPYITGQVLNVDGGMVMNG